MNRYLIYVVAILTVALVLSWDSARVNAALASESGHRADSIAAVNKVKDAKAKADSVALEQSRKQATAARLALDSLRAGYVQKAVRASASVRVASDSLHALLNGQEAAQEAQRALELGYQTELAAKDSIIVAADSATVVERGLRLATERALASERIAHQGGDAENAALRQQVAQLNRTARRDKIVEALLTAGVVVAVVRNHRRRGSVG